MALLIYSYACRAILRMDIGIAPRVCMAPTWLLHGSYIDMDMAPDMAPLVRHTHARLYEELPMLGYTHARLCEELPMLGYTHARLYSLLLLGTNTKNSP